MKKIKNNLPTIKYYLEIISIPIFAYLVFHLAGHSFAEFFADAGHGHEHTHDDHSHGELDIFEILGGVFALIIFTLIWNTKKMKRFVPCSHTHCHGEKIFGHILASLVFVFHFFPESVIRYNFIESFDIVPLLSVFGLIAFASHFFIDLTIIFLISSYWKEMWQKIMSMILMIGTYIISYYVGKNGGLELHFLGEFEIFIGLISAFVLAMFIHIPEKPNRKSCNRCHD